LVDGALGSRLRLFDLAFTTRDQVAFRIAAALGGSYSALTTLGRRLAAINQEPFEFFLSQ